MAQTAKSHAGDVHAKTFWMDGVWAGLIAGVVFMMMEMLLVWMIKGDSPWGPPRMIAAMIMGEEVLPPPATFSFGIVMVAMMIHFMLSIVYGLLGAWMVHRFDVGLALLIGAVFGLAIYIVNFHMVVPFMFPWFVMARGAISIVSHIAFGMVLTGAYIALRGRHVTE